MAQAQVAQIPVMPPDFLKSRSGIEIVLNNPLLTSYGRENKYLVYRMLQSLYAHRGPELNVKPMDAEFLFDVAQKTTDDWRTTFTDNRATSTAKVMLRYVSQLLTIAQKVKKSEPAVQEPPKAEEKVVVAQPRQKREKQPRMKVYKETAKRIRNFGQGNRLVTVSGDEWYFLVSFPEAEIAQFEEALKAIPSAAFFHRTELPYVPTREEERHARAVKAALKKGLPAPESKQPAAVPAVAWKQVWRIRKTDETLMKVVAFAKKYKFDCVGDLLMQAQLATEDSKSLYKRSYWLKDPAFVTPKLPKDLKPYAFQLAGAHYAEDCKRTFIADEMGLGKTIQALLVMKKANKWPWLVIVPSSVKINWYREVKKWFGKEFKVGIASNTHLVPLIRSAIHKPYTDAEKKKFKRESKKWLAQQQVVIVNYDRIRKYSEHLEQMDWQGCILDESHYCKAGSQRTKAVMSLILGADSHIKGVTSKGINPEYILLLSGTPVMNTPKELIRQLHIIGFMNAFGGPIHFMNRYCNVVNVDMSKMPKLPKPDENGNLPAAIPGELLELRDQMIRKLYENQVELNRQMRSMCYVRREKEDAMPQLPEKTRTAVYLDITNREVYESAEKDVIKFLMDRVSKDEKFLAKIKGLSKEAQVRAIKERRSEVQFRSARAEAFARIEALKQIAAVGKLDAAQAWIENVLENDEKLITFAHHNNIIDELESRFPKVSAVHKGGMSDEAKQESIDKFQEEGNYKGNKRWRHFIASLKMAVGYTVTKARIVAFMELGWTPAAHDQAEDRSHRIGQKRAVNAYYLIAKGTIEEWIARKIEKKRSIVDASAFGDPLAKVTAQGDILGELVSHLVGKKIDPRLDFMHKMEDSSKSKSSSRSKSKKPAAKKPTSKHTHSRRRSK